ncbi:MAG TPA: TonB family protein [Bryobacteraceae bacterium]|nr:TonB family protein [Bryobacteraceae bacterium]
MSRFVFFAFVSALAPALLGAQAPTGSGDVLRVGPGVTPPRLLHKVEPEYSPSARAAHVQGTVVLQLVVDEKGRATDITLISPLGFGLDEQAETAVEKWTFAPGVKDGRPVKILASVEVNFRFPQIWFDEKAERQRTSFNVALQSLKRVNASTKAVDRAVKSMQDLSERGFPPAMYLVGVWEINGEHITKDPAHGFALIQKAAAKDYGPAIYEIAVHRIEGQGLSRDVEKGLDEMRQAAVLGSRQAQFYLGNRYSEGNGVPRELDRARRYFRLCAAQGAAICQYKLGSLLLDAPERPERDYVQAVAWFQLAGEQGLQEANSIASREAANLTPAQISWVKTLKAQLVRK